MALIDRKILWLPVHLSARRVEQGGSRRGLPARLQDVQRPELVRRPTGVRILLAPGNPRDGSKVEHRVLAGDGLLDCRVIPDVTANLRTAQRIRVSVEVHVEDCDGIAQVLKLFRQVASDESISARDENPIHCFQP